MINRQQFLNYFVNILTKRYYYDKNRNIYSTCFSIHFEYNRLKDNEQYRDSTNLCMNGWNSLYGSYYLESGDGGKNWYAIDRGEELDQWIVSGKSEDVFPGLLESLVAWDRLTDHTEKNGSIGSSEYITEEDLNSLKGTGITVEK